MLIPNSKLTLERKIGEFFSFLNLFKKEIKESKQDCMFGGKMI